MANRFLETNYYKSPFVRGLKGALKSLYSFIICDCSHSGIWAKDLEAAEMYIGFNVSEDDFDVNFIQKGKAIPIGRGKFFFPDFIEHQYPSGLSTNNKSHTKTILELNGLNLLDESKTSTQKDKKGNEFNTYFAISKKAPLMGLQSPQGNGIGNGSDIGNGKYIIQEMCDIWYNKFQTYTKDKENDFLGMGKILQFILKNGDIHTLHNNPEGNNKVLNTVKLISIDVSENSFWVNKPLKSIANNIQEFYNNIKNPIKKNGAATLSGSNSEPKLGTSAARIKTAKEW